MRRCLIAFVTICHAAFAGAQDSPEEIEEVETTEQEEEQPQGYSSRRSKTGYADSRPVFGGPTSPEGEIVESDTEQDPAFRFPKIDVAMEPWTAWKTELNEDSGVAFSAHYSTMFQGLNDSLPGTDDKSSAGVLRGTLQWTPIGRGTANKGTLNVMLDHRHGFRDTTPAGIANSAGYIGLTGLFYNDMGFAVINLNWQQGFNDGDTGIIVGRFDPNDYMNVLGYVNPWTIFSNLAINLDVSVALPDSSWGIGGGHYPRRNT